MYALSRSLAPFSFLCCLHTTDLFFIKKQKTRLVMFPFASGRSYINEKAPTISVGPSYPREQ